MTQLVQEKREHDAERGSISLYKGEIELHKLELHHCVHKVIYLGYKVEFKLSVLRYRHSKDQISRLCKSLKRRKGGVPRTYQYRSKKKKRNLIGFGFAKEQKASPIQ